MKQKVKLLIENQGKLLLLQPLKKQKFTLIGGTVDSNETIIEAGIREGFEEAGLMLEHDNFKTHFVCLSDIGGKPTLFYCFLLQLGDLVVELKEKEKFQALDWVPLNEGLSRLKGVERKAAAYLLTDIENQNFNYGSYRRVV